MVAYHMMHTTERIAVRKRKKNCVLYHLPILIGELGFGYLDSVVLPLDAMVGRIDSRRLRNVLVNGLRILAG